MTNIINSTLSNTTGDKLQCQPSVWILVMMALGIFDIIMSLPTVPWALWILIRNSALGTELSIFNILCTDIISILLTPVSFFTIFDTSSTSIIMKGVFFFYIVYLIGYPLFQCGLCFERYVAVVHPVTYLKYRVMRYKLTYLVLTWMMTLAMSVFSFISFNTYLLLVILILVVCSEAFFSISILKVLKRSSPGDRRRKQENDTKKRAFIIVVVLQMKLLFNYMPYILFSTFQDAFSDNLYFCYLIVISTNICSFGHFFQAFLYLQKVGKFSTG